MLHLKNSAPTYTDRGNSAPAAGRLGNNAGSQNENEHKEASLRHCSLD